MALAMLLTLFAAPAMAGDIKVVLDGKNVAFTVPPMIDNGSTLVPMRAIFEAMGATVSWDQATQTATGVKGDTKVILPIGSTSPTINGTVKTIAVPGKVVNGSTLAPLRFIGEAFGGTVTWDGATQTATIVSAKTTAPVTETKPATETKPTTPTKPATETKPAVTAATPADAVKAAIAAFKPAKASYNVAALVKKTSMGDINVKITGTGDIDASKKASSKWSGDLGALGSSNPTGAYCPFSELICGPEADALKIVNGGTISEEGGFTVITVTGVPVPASMKSVMDNTSQMVKVAFTLNMDAKIKIDKASGRVASIEITKLTGTGVASIGTYESSGTASVTYTY